MGILKSLQKSARWYILILIGSLTWNPQHYPPWVAWRSSPLLYPGERNTSVFSHQLQCYAGFNHFDLWRCGVHTVVLTVTDFWRPSGDTCSSSATTLISCALTTDATSWPSACTHINRQRWSLQSNRIVSINPSLSHMYACMTERPGVAGSRHFPDEGQRTAPCRCWFAPLEWSIGCP